MKKNILFSLFAMAALLFATSCQNEELFGGANVDTEVVSYTISTQELGTRADGTPRYEGYNLYWGVYEHVSKDQGTSLVYVKAISADLGDDKAKNIEHGQVQVDIQLAKQKTYTIVFWAQHAENPMCVVDWDDRKVSFIEALTANQKTYDAFWASDKDVTLNGASQKTVKLVRPFAQINIGAGDFAEFVAASGEENAAIKTSAIKVKNVPLGMDIVTGDIDAYTETSTMTFAASAILPDTEEFPVDDNQYIALGYVLADANQNLVDIELTYTTTNEENKTYSNEFTNVPVKRNHRTNIYGNLLTGNAGYDVEVDDNYGDGDNNVEVVEVATASDLQETIENMEDGDSLTIVLTDDIDLGALFAAANSGNTGSNAPALRAGIDPQPLVLETGRTLTLDLNGKTISQTKTQTAAYSMITNKGTLTIIDSKGNGKLSYKDEGNGGEYVSNTIQNSGTLIIKGGSIENNSGTNHDGYPHPIDNSGKLIIDGGTVTSNANYSSMRIWCTTDDNTEVTINGGSFNGSIDFQTVNQNANKGILTINGGTFNADEHCGCAVRLLGFGTDVDELHGYINGGTFNGEIKLRNYVGGEFNSKVFVITGGTFKVDPSEYVADGYPVNAPDTEGGYYTIGEFTPVAKIGDKEYGSLRAAVAAVQDGETITLVADEVFTETNRCDNGGWWDGLAYSGDKSFTIDLGGYTIKQDGSLNDYLIWIKNDGAKANTITFKNGTMDAGTTAYSAFATASSNKQTITVNLENINLINNISSGAVVKARGGSVLNVKAGTVITGKDSYVGIEAVGNNTVVNVYEGAEIYQNGTTHFVGAIIGASYNATLNIYGGKGTSAKCGIIVMSTGATINVSGGEWTANGNGTVAGGNQGVLVSQNNRNESGWACKSILNVTGGTFKGGYDCWGMGPGVEPDDAQIHISGGNFNADPSDYLANGYAAKQNENNLWTIVAAPAVVEGGYEISNAAQLKYFAESVNAGESTYNGTTIKLAADIDLQNEPWTPIGFNSNSVAGSEKYFTGTFDGQDHTIRNLKIDVKDCGGVGLFGTVYNASFKNFTLENVDIKAVESEDDPANTSGAENHSNYIVGGHTGAVVGYDAKAGEVNFENVHVRGLVKIEGETRAAQGQRIGGIIGGRGSSKMTFKNVSVIGTYGSYIKGYCSTAGVSGQIQNVATYENVHTDIDVYAVTFGAGGIAGIVRQGSTFTSCSSAGDITLDASKTQLSSYSANYPYRVGGMAGCWSESATGVLTLTDCTYTGKLTSIDRDGNSPQALDYAGYVGRGYALNDCQGSKVTIDNVEYVQAYNKAAESGLYIVDGVYTIVSAANLKVFAGKVNSGEDYFEGKIVKLANDIDLNNEEWTPIGSATLEHGFMGNFDGNGKTIKNLKMTKLTTDSDNYVYAGLFGVAEGTDANNQNYIKNLVIENVTIETTGHIAAAAIAYPYYTTVENITVKGNINIKGGDYTSGVLAYTRRCVNAKNLAIEGNTGSSITGNQTVGGVISDIQMNGGLTANYSNFKTSGLTITGKQSVGGISGIIASQTLDGATVKNVTLVCDDNRTGIVAGALGGISTIKNIVTENVTGATNIVGGTYDNGAEVVRNGDEFTAKN